MKHLFLSSLLLAVLIAQSHAAENSNEIRTPYQVSARGADHRIWRSVNTVVDKAGRETVQTNSYTELATGLHRLVGGEYIEADPAIELHPEGAIALNTRHKVKFSGNINNWQGAIEFQAPDGTRLTSRPLGISYFDTATGESVLIAELKNRVGEIHPPAKVMYEDAFSDLKADLEYNNSLAGMQQNLIFREAPPAPEQFGLNNETTWIQFLTEFFEVPNALKKRTLQREGQSDDQQIEFGGPRIIPGKAFMVGNQEVSHHVGKQWVVLEGRNFLVEQLPYKKVAAMLHQLPAAPLVNNGPIKKVASKQRYLPAKEVAQVGAKQPKNHRADRVGCGWIGCWAN